MRRSTPNYGSTPGLANPHPTTSAVTHSAILYSQPLDRVNSEESIQPLIHRRDPSQSQQQEQRPEGGSAPKRFYVSSTTGKIIEARVSENGIMTGADGHEETVVERRVSYGIGGAGNIRLPSEVKQSEIVKDAETGQELRRSSVWSTSSAGSRRASIIKLASGLFGKKGSVSDAENHEAASKE